MKTKILLLAFIILACMASSIEAKKKNSGQASIKFSEKTYDFGYIKEDAGLVSHTFEFVNEGDGNLIILDASASCGCTRPSFSDEPIAPGKKGKIKVSYNPKNRPGMFQKSINIRTNGNPRKVSLLIKGDVLSE